MVDIARFWTHIALLDDAENTCWLWVGTMRHDGLGRFWQDGQERRAHWVAWEIQHGRPVPAGYRLKHECSTPECVRHWSLSGPFRKLSVANLREIMESRLGNRALARKLKVSEFAIRWNRKRTYIAAHNSSGRV